MNNFTKESRTTKIDLSKQIKYNYQQASPKYDVLLFNIIFLWEMSSILSPFNSNLHHAVMTLKNVFIALFFT